MTSYLMSSIVDGSMAALGIAAAVTLLISALVTSETRLVRQLERPQAIPLKPVKRSA